MIFTIENLIIFLLFCDVKRILKAEISPEEKMINLNTDLIMKIALGLK
jgi:hypothetical protein